MKKDEVALAFFDAHPVKDCANINLRQPTL